MNQPIVVVGAGQAATEFAVALRAQGYAGPIQIIGDEPYLPYQRPPLSKDFLSGKSPYEKLMLRPDAFWHEQKVEFLLGSAAVNVDRAKRTLTLADGRELSYGTLVLATGTRARIPPLPGIDLPGVFTLRKVDDVKRMRPALDAARRVAIVGGGYIGLEVAAVARSEGREVTILEAEERVMKRVTCAEVSGFYQDMHRGHGVDVRTGSRIEAIEAGGVRLSGGEQVAADLVLVSTGARPNEELARDAGIACDDGIIVDEFARTADEHIYAVGDCTRLPSRRYGRAVRLECVQNAFDQAKAAAAALAGKGTPYDPVPWFWSDQYHVKFQSCGLSSGHDEAKVVGDMAAGHFSVEYRKDGKLIAVDAVNDARAYMMGRKTIAAETA
ncbi:MAG TPA: FAD-dependent oxidoreductase [Xanthobacteraceae bacterium]|nr:FAD-dependent oxidoreductase [Xanthobacteraceae bacterium]